MLQFGGFSRFMSASRRLLIALTLLAWLFPAQAQTKYALLIGINTYQPAGTTVRHPAGVNTGRFAPGAPLFDNLAGPTNDVASMRGVLTSSKFGFPDDEQHMHVLLNGDATRAGILDAMKKYLVDQPQKGDTVVFYIASHGSLRVNSKSKKQVFDLAGKPTPLDNTIVPADAYLGSEDIRDREMARVFNKALDKGIHLTAIFDTCHSGGTARGAQVGPRTVARMLAYDPRDIAEAPDRNADGTPVVAPTDRKDNGALVFSATQVDQKAQELPDATPPHGVFTMALIDALQQLPADIPADDLWKRVQIDLEVQGISSQQPMLDGTQQRKEQSLFGQAPGNVKVRAAVARVGDDGIVLDIGTVADIGIGSEFVALRQGDRTTLRITATAGINRSLAAVVSPAGAQVVAKDLFELTKWVPAHRTILNLWVPPSNLTQEKIAAVVTEARSSGLRLVRDPSRQAWTWLIGWDGTQWTLQKAGVRGSEPLGPTFAAAVLLRKIGRDAAVWFNLPPPSELASRLVNNRAGSAAQVIASEQQALYRLVGTVTDAGPAYAWYNQGDFIAGRQTPEGYGNGCSPDSHYPIRTDWASGRDTAATLQEDATKLARLNGWLLLPALEGQSGFPYHLALERIADQKILEDKGATYENESYSLLLRARGDTRADARSVYVLAVDCQGTGSLAYPLAAGNNVYPQEGGRLDQIPLPGVQMTIGPPFGTDTYILLSTSTPLSSPAELNFTGVVRGGASDGKPIDNLVGQTSSGVSGNVTEMPIDWGVEYLEMHSHPKP
jgi:hypothetical protein